LGYVPAYAEAGADVEPAKPKRARRPSRLTEPEPEKVSSAEFEQMKRDLEIEEQLPTRHTSTLTKRLSHTEETAAAPTRPKRGRGRDGRAAAAQQAPGRAPETEAAPAAREPDSASAREPDGAPGREPDGAPTPAPDIPENEGVAPAPKPRPQKPKARSRRRHGRSR